MAGVNRARPLLRVPSAFNALQSCGFSRHPRASGESERQSPAPGRTRGDRYSDSRFCTARQFVNNLQLIAAAKLPQGCRGSLGPYKLAEEPLSNLDDPVAHTDVANMNRAATCVWEKVHSRLGDDGTVCRLSGSNSCLPTIHRKLVRPGGTQPSGKQRGEFQTSTVSILSTTPKTR
jgi:hypothetical protein